MGEPTHKPNRAMFPNIEDDTILQVLEGHKGG